MDAEYDPKLDSVLIMPDKKVRSMNFKPQTPSRSMRLTYYVTHIAWAAFEWFEIQWVFTFRSTFRKCLSIALRKFLRTSSSIEKSSPKERSRRAFSSFWEELSPKAISSRILRLNWIRRWKTLQKKLQFSLVFNHSVESTPFDFVRLPLLCPLVSWRTIVPLSEDRRAPKRREIHEIKFSNSQLLKIN